MRKQLTAMLLALILMVSLLPMPAMAANTDEDTEIKAAVTKLIHDYAKKVYQPEADDNAFSLFFKHGFFGNSKDMILTEESPMVASLFNTELLQEGLINGISNTIIKMGDLNLDAMYLYSDISWHNYYYNYSFTGNAGTEYSIKNRIGTMASTKSLYGDNHYPGTGNENDNVMELLVGSMYAPIVITRGEAKNGRAVFNINIHLKDDFDFQGSYTTLEEKGYNTTKDDTLKDLGLLMTFVGLDEFYWEYKVSFTLELPYTCDHGLKNYHWTYDGSTATVSSEAGSGYTQNDTTKLKYEYTNSTTGETAVKYYHELDDKVVLKHDQPWVMEWDQKVLRTHQFSPLNIGSGYMPILYSYGRYYIWFYYYENEYYPEDQIPASGSKYYSITHYIGVETKDKFTYSSKYTYTHKLENVLNPDGTNTIYLTIYNNDLEEVAFGPEPMDDHWYKTAKMEARELESDCSTLLSGRDIIINYLGNKSCGLSQPETVLDMRIWEGGKEYTESAPVYKAPTCTDAGGMQHYCPDCGGTYVTDGQPALGHSFGEYADDNNAACLTDGTKTRTCTRCGLKDTVSLTGTALGHSFGEYLSDSNATCLTDGTKTAACVRCSTTDTIADPDSALGHDFGKFVSDNNATCTDNGTKTRACTRCDAKESATDIGTAKGHSYTPAVTAPTCTDGGYTTYTCHCGDSYVADETPAVGHTEVEDPAIPATCISSGKKAGSHCSVCGVVTKEQELIPIGNHSWDQGTVIKEPTLSEMGTLMYTCIHCDSKNYMSIDKLPTLGFSDVPADAYYANAVAWAKNKGITSGLSDTLFGSDMSCTRGQVVTFLWAAAGRPEPTGSDNPFTDVYESDYYYKPVLWAVEQGITGGIGDGLFGPHRECTRGQIVTFLWRAMNSPEPAGKNTFTDVAESDWFAQPVLWASENTITGGIGNGMFGPYQECTRAQVVTFLYKVYN